MTIDYITNTQIHNFSLIWFFKLRLKRKKTISVTVIILRLQPVAFQDGKKKKQLKDLQGSEQLASRDHSEIISEFLSKMKASIPDKQRELMQVLVRKVVSTVDQKDKGEVTIEKSDSAKYFIIYSTLERMNLRVEWRKPGLCH